MEGRLSPIPALHYEKSAPRQQSRRAISRHQFPRRPGLRSRRRGVFFLPRSGLPPVRSLLPVNEDSILLSYPDVHFSTALMIWSIHSNAFECNCPAGECTGDRRLAEGRSPAISYVHNAERPQSSALARPRAGNRYLTPLSPFQAGGLEQTPSCSGVSAIRRKCASLYARKD